MSNENGGCGCGCLTLLIQLFIIGVVAYVGFLIICGLFSILPYVIILILIGAMVTAVAKLFS